jgi:ribose transport system ATP-binding protein
MNNPPLEMTGISKRFPGVVALDSVDFKVNQSEILALVGENGAGKSTLMKILGGVYQPDSGSIRIDGNEVTINSVRDAMGYGIGFIHQELNVLDNLDIAGNVFLGREPVKWGPLKLIDSAKMRVETQHYLSLLGVDLPAHTPLNRLSIAQQQMVEIAKALSLKARILIMDEPTSSLTLTETERLTEVTKGLRDKGVSIIYISHRLGEVSDLADRVVVLRDGKSVGSLEGDEITHRNMVRLMVGRELETFYVHSKAEKKPGYFQVQNLCTTRYPQSPLTFDLAKGEILGFAGLVGAGRSEMAQAVFGVDPKLSGSIRLEGNEQQINSPDDAIACGIYLAPEDRRRSGLVTQMSIQENVTLPGLSRYTSAGLIQRDKERNAAMKVCSTLNVKAPSVGVPVWTLSGGNQQKVVLAKWLALEPKVLIFDEPTRGIDVGAKAEIYQLMRDLAEKGVAIIMISSDMEEILGVSDRVAVMHEGTLTGVLEREDCSEESVMRLAVGEASI